MVLFEPLIGYLKIKLLVILGLIITLFGIMTYLIVSSTPVSALSLIFNDLEFRKSEVAVVLLLALICFEGAKSYLTLDMRFNVHNNNKYYLEKKTNLWTLLSAMLIASALVLLSSIIHPSRSMADWELVLILGVAGIVPNAFLLKYKLSNEWKFKDPLIWN